MNHERMLRAEKQLQQNTNALMRKAQILYVQVDRRSGKGNCGSELPDELRSLQDGLAKIRQARREMEVETAAAAAGQRHKEAEQSWANAATAHEAHATAAESPS